MRKLRIKHLVMLAVISATIFTAIAFSVDARAGWAMSVVVLIVLIAAWIGLITKAFVRSLFARITSK